MGGGGGAGIYLECLGIVRVEGRSCGGGVGFRARAIDGGGCKGLGRAHEARVQLGYQLNPWHPRKRIGWYT